MAEAGFELTRGDICFFQTYQSKAKENLFFWFDGVNGLTDISEKGDRKDEAWHKREKGPRQQHRRDKFKRLN